jgi:hypothetical protein
MTCATLLGEFLVGQKIGRVYHAHMPKVLLNALQELPIGLTQCENEAEAGRLANEANACAIGRNAIDFVASIKEAWDTNRRVFYFATNGMQDLGGGQFISIADLVKNITKMSMDVPSATLMEGILYLGARFSAEEPGPVLINISPEILEQNVASY